MSIKKIIKIIGIAILVFIAGFIVKDRKHIFSFPGIISAYYSKEFCSCYFVEKQTEQFCHDYARQYIPIQDFKLDGKTVTVKGLFITNSASYVSERLGCRID